MQDLPTANVCVVCGKQFKGEVHMRVVIHLFGDMRFFPYHAKCKSGVRKAVLDHLSFKWRMAYRVSCLFGRDHA